MRLVVCDDHAMFLDALTVALEAYGHEIVPTTSSGEVIDLVDRCGPDAVLLDVQLQDACALALARDIRQRCPSTPILLLTVASDDSVRCAFDERVVDGLVGKLCGTRSLDLAIRRVVAGQPTVVGWPPSPAPDRSRGRTTARLTDRELQVLRLITDGASTSSMALQLGVSVNTVRTHVRGVLQKLDVHHRAKAAHMAHELGLLAHR